MKLLVRSTTLIAVTAVLLGIPGCGSTKTGDSQSGASDKKEATGSLPEIPAADFLRQVLTRYRSTRSYRDLGEVRLRVEKEGRVDRRVAPMHVMLDGSTIWIAAYDARVWSDGEKTIGWITDESTNFHDSQVVIGASATARRSANRPALENLLRDPILTARMISGLGGPPPQLEWLLDPNPMAKLFGDGPTDDPQALENRSIRYEGVARRENVECVVVKAIAGNDSYRFWIDQNRSLIHCVELPVSMAGEQIELEGWRVRSLELVLADASFQSPETPYQIGDMPKSDFPSRAKYLRSLVPLPPPPPERRLGGLVGAMDVMDASGRVRVTARGIDRKFTLWYACFEKPIDDAGIKNMQAAERLSLLLRQSGESIRDNVRPVACVDEHSRQLFVESGLANGFWVLVNEQNNTVLRNLGLQQGQATLVDSQGRVIWVGDPLSPPDMVSLAAVSSDAINGVDVPAQIRRQWESDREAYRQKIAELAVPFEMEGNYGTVPE